MSYFDLDFEDLSDFDEDDLFVVGVDELIGGLGLLLLFSENIMEELDCCFTLFFGTDVLLGGSMFFDPLFSFFLPESDLFLEDDPDFEEEEDDVALTVSGGVSGDLLELFDDEEDDEEDNLSCLLLPLFSLSLSFSLIDDDDLLSFSLKLEEFTLLLEEEFAADDDDTDVDEVGGGITTGAD